MHCAAEHSSPSAQALSQPPQCSGSESSARHEPEQSARLSGHSAAHLPWKHTCPSTHALPHPPQCSRVACRSKHAPPHAESPLGHASAQVPWLQTSLAAQAWSQPPRCEALERVSTQVPAHATVGAEQRRPGAEGLKQALRTRVAARIGMVRMPDLIEAFVEDARK